MKFARIDRFAATCLAGALLISAARAAEEAGAVESRLAKSVGYLASDELEGRGVGTKGLDLAADYIAAQFREIGLKTALFAGQPFQKFKMTTGASLGPRNELTFVGPASEPGTPPKRIEWKLGEQFNPLAIGGSGKLDLPLVFVGYGITAKDEHYDDYAKVDVRGKAVVIMRHEPQQANPHSVFDGDKNSEYAPFKRKISNAYEHGAAAVVFVTDDFDIRKSVDAARKRWQAAVDQIAEENGKFKALDNPSDQARAKHEEQIAALAEDVKKFAEQMKEAADPMLPFDGCRTRRGRRP